MNPKHRFEEKMVLHECTEGWDGSDCKRFHDGENYLW